MSGQDELSKLLLSKQNVLLQTGSLPRVGTGLDSGKMKKTELTRSGGGWPVGILSKAGLQKEPGLHLRTSLWLGFVSMGLCMEGDEDEIARSQIPKGPCQLCEGLGMLALGLWAPQFALPVSGSVCTALHPPLGSSLPSSDRLLS